MRLEITEEPLIRRAPKRHILVAGAPEEIIRVKQRAGNDSYPLVPKRKEVFNAETRCAHVIDGNGLYSSKRWMASVEQNNWSRVLNYAQYVLGVLL